jgi:hypothetical protein
VNPVACGSKAEVDALLKRDCPARSSPHFEPGPSRVRLRPAVRSRVLLHCLQPSGLLSKSNTLRVVRPARSAPFTAGLGRHRSNPRSPGALRGFRRSRYVARTGLCGESRRPDAVVRLRGRDTGGKEKFVCSLPRGAVDTPCMGRGGDAFWGLLRRGVPIVRAHPDRDGVRHGNRDRQAWGPTSLAGRDGRRLPADRVRCRDDAHRRRRYRRQLSKGTRIGPRTPFAPRKNVRLARPERCTAVTVEPAGVSMLQC